MLAMPCEGRASPLTTALRGTCVAWLCQDMAGNRIPLGRGIVGHVAATGQVVNVPDAYEDPRFDATLDAKTGVRTRSILCVPVCVTRGKPIAVIEAVTVSDAESDGEGSQGVTKRGFDETDVQALSAFSAEVRGGAVRARAT